MTTASSSPIWPRSPSGRAACWPCPSCSGSGAGARGRRRSSTGCTGIVRLVYVELTSPAAFVAIGSGTALIFLQATFVEWFSIKMVLVGIMAMLHVVAGLVVLPAVLAHGPFRRCLVRQR